jgi:hypothetical protein
VADLDKILRLVAEGVLTPEEADEIIAALTADRQAAAPPPPPPPPSPDAQRRGGRHLRIEVSEGGRKVVNLRVPLNIAGLATAFVPGLSDEDSEHIREAIASGIRGPILDIGSDDGDRVLIVTE